MTYKHVKFQDSETMRSLVKVAYDKGMIAPESTVEKALKAQAAKAAEPDLSVSDSVQENLLKLCAGLRAKGFTSHAAKIENHIVALKFAQTAEQVDRHEMIESSEGEYDVSGETGEDLMDEAHPEGAVEVAEAGDGHGVVDTKPSAHQKLLDIVTKAQVINSLKLVLAQAAPAPTPVENTQDIVRGLVHQYSENLKSIILDVLNTETVTERIFFDFSVGSWFPYSSAQSHLEALMEKLDAMVKQADAQPTKGNMDLLGTFEWAFKTIINKIDAIAPEVKKQYAAKADQAFAFIQQAIATLKNNNKSVQPNTQAGPTQLPAPLANVLAKITNLTGEIAKLKGVINAQVMAKEFTKEEGEQGMAWLDSQLAAVKQVKDKVDAMPKNEDRSKELQVLNGILENIITEFTKFESIWG